MKKIEIDMGALAKATKRVGVKATSKRKAHYRMQEVGNSQNYSETKGSQNYSESGKELPSPETGLKPTDIWEMRTQRGDVQSFGIRRIGGGMDQSVLVVSKKPKMNKWNVHMSVKDCDLPSINSADFENQGDAAKVANIMMQVYNEDPISKGVRFNKRNIELGVKEYYTGKNKEFVSKMNDAGFEFKNKLWDKK